MTNNTDAPVQVTQAEAIAFLESAVRNWGTVNFDQGGIDDVRVELERFVSRHRAASNGEGADGYLKIPTLEHFGLLSGSPSPAQEVDETERLRIRALRAAEQFIVNGIEMGYIRMPEPSTPDSAHDTLPLIRAALKAREAQP